MQKNRKKQIVIIGDSNTEGYGLYDYQSYPYKLGQLLKSTDIHNMGVSGTCVINTQYDGEIMGMPYVMQDKYKEALSIDGDIFIINLGTNDAQDGMDDALPVIDEHNNMINQHDRFIGDYQRIINDIKRAHPKSKIILCIPVPIRECVWRKHQQKYLEILLPYFNEIIKSYEGIYCIDLHSAFINLGAERMNTMYLPDGLHLNDRGTSFTAEYIASHLKNLL